MILTPSIEEIRKSQSPFPTLGELHLVGKLAEILKAVDDLQLIFQPRIGRGRADVVLLRKNHGCAIIEVKDWHLSSYNITKDEISRTHRWYAKQGDYEVYSPHKQVLTYKNDLIDEARLEELIRSDKRRYGLISTVLYFANTPHAEAVLHSEPYIKCIGRGFWTGDTEILLAMLGLNQRRDSFDNDFYVRLSDVLVRKSAPETPVIVYNPTRRQREAIDIPASGRRKIRGCAGSGKTYVGAVIAAEQAQKGNDVLVTVFNEAAKWSFRRVIAQLDLVFDRGKVIEQTIFKIAKPFKPQFEDNYALSGDFFKAGLEAIESRLIERTSFPDHELYDTIIVDEAQDYRFEWLQVLEKHYLKPGGRMIILADEGQNIYGNDLEEQRVRTPIAGAWFRLNEHNRASPDISKLCDDFRHEFLNDLEGTEMPQSLSLSITKGYELFSVNADSCRPLLKSIDSVANALVGDSAVEAPLIIGRTNKLLSALAAVLDEGQSGSIRIRCTSESEQQRIETFLAIVNRFSTNLYTEVCLNGDSITGDFRMMTTAAEWAQFKFPQDKISMQNIARAFQQSMVTARTSMIPQCIQLAHNIYRTLCSIVDGTTQPNPQVVKWKNDLAHEFSFELARLRTALKTEIFQLANDLAISTPHSAKGVERSVTIVVVDDQWDSNPNARQLMYTALSRAKNELHVIYDARSAYADFFRRRLHN